MLFASNKKMGWGRKEKKIDKFHHPSNRNNNNKNKNKKDGQEPKDLNTHKEEKCKHRQTLTKAVSTKHCSVPLRTPLS